MSSSHTLNKLVSMTNTSMNRYRLDIPSCSFPLDVENFSGNEALSELYCYSIYFTGTDRNIEPEQLVRKPATLTMGTCLLQSPTEQKVVHGVITYFQRFSRSGCISDSHRAFPQPC